MRKSPAPDTDDRPSNEPREPNRLPARTQPSDSGTIVGSAYVYLRPDTRLEPLRVLEGGTSVKVLQENGDWIRIQFSDHVLGPRIGYVQRQYIQLPREQ
jgi:hypothetical protein